MFSAYCPDLLLGQRLTDVARTPDFVVRWTFSGRTSPYILQTYGGFRVTHEGETILTQRMLFTQTDLEPLTDANRRFDRDVVRLTSLLPVKIVSVKCSDTNDLTLCAENHLRIEIFADSLPLCENWRFGPQDDMRLSAFTDCVHLK
mgnify:FL=1